MDYRIFPPDEIPETTVTRLPLSKSIAARMLVMNAMSRSAAAPDIARIPDCEDTRVLAVALSRTDGDIDVGACGTAARFLTAYYAATPGTSVTIGGTARLNARPVAPLVEALRALGADIRYAAAEGCMPLIINGRQLAGGRVALDASASSQFASALAMAGPLMAAPLVIDLGGEIASLPYLRMTLAMMRARHVEADIEGYEVHVAATPYGAAVCEAEPDWSAAAFWYETAALSAGWFTLPGLKEHSLQGDSILAKIGDRIGVVTEFTDEGVELSATPDLYSRLDLDAGDFPDLVPALAVTAAMAGIPFKFTRVGNLRHKECDRLDALVTELRKVGRVLEAGDDWIGWEGDNVPVTEMPVMDPHGDHRMAMAFAPMSVWIPGIVVRDAGCVAKSYPGFWDDLRDAGFRVEDAAAETESEPEE